MIELTFNEILCSLVTSAILGCLFGLIIRNKRGKNRWDSLKGDGLNIQIGYFLDMSENIIK